MTCFLPFIVMSWSNIGNGIIEQTKEEHEEKIIGMLKRMGLRATVKIAQNAITFFSSLIFLATPVFIFVKYLAFTNVQYLFFLTYMWTVAVEFFMLEIIL